ncbi:phage head-tail connector protein [Carnobacterium maltaromaticum]|uniref:phage head-tail connector protein n=1 Tax=Carnobacterium maltaromaticum TaxID=2751 RepID=UPI0039AF29DE
MDKKNEEALTSLKEQLALKLSITDEQKLAVLTDDLADALSDVLDYTNRDVLVGNMPTSVKDLYIIRSNQEGNEGETSRSEGGVSQAFEEGIPKRIRSKLNRYRMARMRSM